MIGTTLSHYEITAELGRGGMGIVYKARDTKLDREVAIKVLPSAALASADDRERFYREAKSAAALNHPNIAQVYQIDEAVPSDAPHGTEPSPFIAMEFISGGTLQDRIKEAPLSLSDAVKMASQVAEALKAAHAKDIVHRDIKSANVMITDDGVAKVLDFGLAKTNQSTMLTRMGSTLGTVAYMSPEQAKGQEVDGRTDLYSLGTMLYEMVAGRLPFSGEYEQAVVYSILNEPPEPLTSLRTGVPMQLEWIVNKLMAKDADYRYQTAADLQADLKTLDLSGSGHSRRSMAGMSASSMPATEIADPDKRQPSWIWGALAAVLLIGVAGGWLLFSGSSLSPETPRLLRVDISGYEGELVGLPHGSTEGRYWSFSGLDSAATPVVVMWDVLRNEFRRIPDSEATWSSRFSPSGEWIASRDNAQIFRARVPNGRALRIYHAGPGDEVDAFAWKDDESIYLADKIELKLLSIETGGVVNIPLVEMDSTYNEFAELQYVKEAGRLLVWAEGQGGEIDLLWLDVDDGSYEVLVQAVGGGWMLGRDILLYLSVAGGDGGNDVGQVVAQRIDYKSGRLSGIPVDVSELDIGAPGFNVGRDGTLFLLQGVLAASGGLAAVQVITRYNPLTDSHDGVGLPPSRYDRFWPSPDGRQVVVERTNSSGPNQGTHLYVYDLESKSERRLTYTHPVNRAPVWSADGVIYYSVGPPLATESSIYKKNADGSGTEELVVEYGDFPAVSNDGEWLAYSRDDGENGGDVEALNLNTGDVVVVDSSGMYTGDPAFSPDGRFIAISKAPASGSNTVSGEQRVFVHSFPDASEYSTQVVDEYADDPFFSSDGSTLYYRTGSVLKAISVSTEGSFGVQSIPSIVETFPGSVQMRVRNDPAGDGLLVKHAQGSFTEGGRVEARFNVLLSAEAYVRALMGED